jgi:hypothetical protein
MIGMGTILAGKYRVDRDTGLGNRGQGAQCVRLTQPTCHARAAKMHSTAAHRVGPHLPTKGGSHARPRTISCRKDFLSSRNSGLLLLL